MGPEILVPLLFVILGLVLIAVEVWLIPGFNIIGIGGAFMIIFGIAYAFMEHGISGGILATAVTIVAGGLLLYLLYKTGAWKRFIFHTQLNSSLESDVEQRKDAPVLGQLGTAITPLRPSGVVRLETGDRIEVTTEGQFIASGSRVRVVATDRRRYFVRLDQDS
jgi:membrane-bound ClpP family serine protease